MNAREIASVASYRASGPGSVLVSWSSSRSGYGSSQGTSPSRVGSGGSGQDCGPSIVTLRLLARRALRQRLVATRYSQVRTEARSSKPPSPRQAASSVSWSASSASWAEPRIR